MLEMFVLNPATKRRRRRVSRRRRKASAWSKLVRKYGVKRAKKVYRRRRRSRKASAAPRRRRSRRIRRSRRRVSAYRLRARRVKKERVRRRRARIGRRMEKLMALKSIMTPESYSKALRYRLIPNKKRRRKSRRYQDNGRRSKVSRRRRSYKRNMWRGHRRDHSIAAKLGWAYQAGRRRRDRRNAYDYIVGKIGKRRLSKYRARQQRAYRRKHPRAARRGGRWMPSRRRSSFSRMIQFPMKAFGRSYRLVANRKRRKTRKSRRRVMSGRRLSRGKGGRFVSRRRKSSRRRRSYKKNFYPFNDNGKRRRRKSSRRRRSYKRNWFVYNDNAKRRRRRTRRSRRYANNGRRSYMRNNAVADVLDTVKSVFDVKFLKDTALPVVGGFFASRAISGFAGAGLLGASYTGWVAHLGNLVSAGLAGAAVGMVLKNPQLAGNVVLGGVVNAVTNIVRDLAGTYGGSLVAASPVLKTALGLSGLGDNLRSQVEAEVMRELGVGDFLTAQQLSRSERVGDFLTSQQLSQSERIGQYPAETSGIAQYPAETSGGGVADFADVASFG